MEHDRRRPLWQQRQADGYCERNGHWWPKGPGPCQTCKITREEAEAEEDMERSILFGDWGPDWEEGDR